MAFVPCAGVAHIALVGETDAQQTVNDLYFISTAGPISALSLAELNSAIGNWYSSVIAPLLSEAWFYSHARARDLTTEFSFVSTNTDGATAGGTAGEQAPNNVSANIVFSSGLAGRNNHGSNRIPGVPNSMVTQDTLDTTWLEDITVQYFTLTAPSTVLPGGWTWVVLSRYSGFTIVDGRKVPTPRAAGVTHEIFDVYFPDDIVDSQKTRLPKHGN